MSHRNRRFAAVVGIVLFAGAAAQAQDWPEWRGSGRTGKVSGFKEPSKWPSAPAQMWKTTVGEGDATPALVGDRLYVFARQGGDEVTLCLGAADGKEIWSDKYAAQAVTGAASRHPGPRSSPAVADGKVVTLGVGGVVSCLDAATGKVAWRKDEFPKVVPQFFTATSPLMVDGMCIAHVGGKDKGAVIAFDLATGDTKWKWAGEGPAYASPVIMTAGGVKQVLVPGEKNLTALAAADGKLLWQSPTPTQGRAYNAATPIVDGDTVISSGGGRGTRALKVEKKGDGFAATEVWANEKLGPGFNTPVLKDGLLFGLSDKGNLFCLDAKTGKTAWIDETKRERENFCAVIDAGTVVLALPSSSELVAFKPGAQKYEEVARVKVASSPTYAHPVIAGNRVFVKDKDSVALLVLE